VKKEKEKKRKEIEEIKTRCKIFNLTIERLKGKIEK